MTNYPMRVDLPEGFEIVQMAPRLGWGRIILPDWLTERYVSLRAFGRAVFLCYCVQKPWLCPVWKREGKYSAIRYFRWWIQPDQP